MFKIFYKLKNNNFFNILMILIHHYLYVELWLWVVMLLRFLKEIMEKHLINLRNKCVIGKNVENLLKNFGEIENE